MEKFIILIDCKEQCIDLYCEFSNVKNFYTVKITDPFHFTFSITEEYKFQCYSKAAEYILDKGRIISITPLSEKHELNVFRSYIRIEEINRHLFRLKK